MERGRRWAVALCCRVFSLSFCDAGMRDGWRNVSANECEIPSVDADQFVPVLQQTIRCGKSPAERQTMAELGAYHTDVQFVLDDGLEHVVLGTLDVDLQEVKASMPELPHQGRDPSALRLEVLGCTLRIENRMRDVRRIARCTSHRRCLQA